MSQAAINILTLMTLLIVKHTIADFLLQTPYQYKNKGMYGHPGGLIHAGIHGILTLPVFLVAAPSTALTGAAIIGVEIVIHYHVDWIKENIVKWRVWTADQHKFWVALGVDQLAHYLTYVGIIAAILHY